MVPGDPSFEHVPVSTLDDSALAEALHAHGLTLAPAEARRVAEMLGREPTLTELTLFDTMWSEHCSYKSSRAVLKAYLPTDASNVVVGPVEDAGVVDFGEVAGIRYGIVIAHESHNHPSQVMPVEGAATGIGGIVRDVYCMGGEVIASLDPLRFGWPEGEGAAQRLEIAREVVSGIWEYGNAIGVPNLGGDVYFHPSFDENCLVNVVAVGIVPVAQITHSAVPRAAATEPYDLILVGKPTDWSGMGGAAFASATLDAAAATENKGSVQVPDPFLKRVLTVANREVLALTRREGVAVGFKDLGAGGVSCVTSELVDAGGFGCDVDLALVHTDGEGVPARVVACSETQERYGLAVPARLTGRILAIYNEDFALPTLYEGACARRIGRVTTDGQYVLRCGDRVLCQAPVRTITSGIRYERPFMAPVRPEVPAEARLTEAADARIGEEWLVVMAHPNIASREYLYRHYDPEVQANTVLRPGEADAGVVAPIPGSRRAVALAVDGNPLLGVADPHAAGARAIVEACRNVACVGGVPAAVTDCLNFGNPEVPEVFWQFREAVRGIAEACRSLGRLDAPGEPLPVISGNVSFYNQSSSGRSVAPSPVVACVGIVDDYRHCRSQRFKSPGDVIYLLGAPSPDLLGSVYYQAGFAAGRPAVPTLDFAGARAEMAAVVALVQEDLVQAVHDISDGGLAVCLAEMALGLEGQRILGARVRLPEDLGDLTLREVLFSEQGGFLVSVPPQNTESVEELLGRSRVTWWRIGEVCDEDLLTVVHPAREQQAELPASQLAQAWQRGLPALLGGEAAAGAVPSARPVSERSISAEEPARRVGTAAATTHPGPRPRIAVLQLPGVNCEDESARALREAGASPEIFRWTRPAAELATFDGFLIPGGFSYQDRVRAGAVAAKDPLLEVLHTAAAGGRPILGICNGCQVLIESGLVPGLNPGAVEVALAANRYPGRRGYYTRWVYLCPHAHARTPFCEGLPAVLPMPVAHVEGRFTHENPEFFSKLAREGYIALEYTDASGRVDGNPNGSLLATAALTNSRGNVLAMMPHPERASWLFQVPEDLPHAWGRIRQAAAGDVPSLQGPGPGRVLLQRLVELC